LHKKARNNVNCIRSISKEIGTPRNCVLKKYVNSKGEPKKLNTSLSKGMFSIKRGFYS